MPKLTLETVARNSHFSLALFHKTHGWQRGPVALVTPPDEIVRPRPIFAGVPTCHQVADILPAK